MSSSSRTGRSTPPSTGCGNVAGSRASGGDRSPTEPPSSTSSRTPDAASSGSGPRAGSATRPRCRVCSVPPRMPMRSVRRLFRIDRSDASIDADVGAEIDTHLAMRVDELVAGGMSPDAARAEARRQFGDVERTRANLAALDAAQHAEARSAEWWRGFGQDVRLAWRQLWVSPVFTLVAVLTLALGIGAVAAIGTVVQQVLFRPLPFPQQDRLVREWPIEPARGEVGMLSVPDLEDWRAGQRDITALGGYWFR